MLRFLTQKLRTQSLNEVQALDPPSSFQQQHKLRERHKDRTSSALHIVDDDVDGRSNPKDTYKSDDERDSGTESDDENPEFEEALQQQHTTNGPDGDGGGGGAERIDESNVDRGQELRRSARLVATSSGKKLMCPSPVLLPLLDADSALPSDSDHFDHHSSEEELEVIHNNSMMMVTKSSSTESLPTSVATSAGSALAGSGRRRRRRRQCATPSTPLPLASFGRQLRPRSKSSNRLGLSTCSKPQYNSNGATKCPSSTYQPEKRKWSQANKDRRRRSDAGGDSSSSDEEVRDLMRAQAAPVEFRTSPPAELLVRPTRSSKAAAAAAAAAASSSSSANATSFFNFCSLNASGSGRSPPTKLFHFSSSNFTPFEVCSVSPRKRHRQMIVTTGHRQSAGSDVDLGLLTATAASNGQHQLQLQRPCLDFEKMQQMRHRSASSMRTTNRELSLLC